MQCFFFDVMWKKRGGSFIFVSCPMWLAVVVGCHQSCAASLGGVPAKFVGYILSASKVFGAFFSKFSIRWSVVAINGIEFKRYLKNLQYCILFCKFIAEPALF
jgi:hypothetical protein